MKRIKLSSFYILSKFVIYSLLFSCRSHIVKLSNKKLLFNIISIVFIIIILYGCSTKCPEFNGDILNWMPYKLNDKIVLINDNYNDTLNVDYVVINHTNKIGFRSQCICTSSFSIQLSSDSIDFSIHFNNWGRAEDSWVYYNYKYIEFYDQFDSLEINNQFYYNVRMYKSSVLHSDYVLDEVYISKYIGIIFISGQNENWLIKDDSKRQIEIGDIPYKSDDC